VGVQALEVGHRDLSEEVAQRLHAVVLDSSARLAALEKKGTGRPRHYSVTPLKSSHCAGQCWNPVPMPGKGNQGS